MASEQDEIARLRLELERSEREVARIPDLEQALQLARRRLTIAEAEQAREREAQAAQAGRDREALQAELDHLRSTLDELKRSPSWRVTRPLRALKRALG